MKGLHALFLLFILLFSQLSLAEECPAPLESSAFTPFAEELRHIVALKVNGRLLAQPVDAVWVNEQILLSVSQFALIIESDLNADRSSKHILAKLPSGCELSLQLGQAESGWYWSEDTFDIYLDLRAIKAIYQAEAEFDYSQQLIVIGSPSITLSKLAALSSDSALLYSYKPDLILRDQYRAFTYPVVDYSLRAQLSDKGKTSFNNAFNAYADAGYHGTELRYNQNNSGDFLYLKVVKELGKQTTDTPYPYWRYELGDITTNKDNLINQSSLGLGVNLFRDYGRSNSDYSRITIEEPVLPGWRAELYRNGQFVGSKSADANNLVRFEDVELFFGENQFEVRLFGPSGESSSRYQSYSIDDTLLQQGDYKLQLMVQDPQRTLFVQGAENQSAMARKFGLNYGLTDRLSAGLAVNQLSYHDVTHNYLLASLASTLNNASLKFEVAKDEIGGLAGFVGYQGILARVNRINLEYKHFDEFISQINVPERQLTSSSRGVASGPLDWGLSSTFWQLSGNYDRLLTGGRQSSAQARLSQGLFGSTLAISLNSPDIHRFQDTRGNVYWVAPFRHWLFTNNLDVKVTDGPVFQRWQSEVRWSRGSHYISGALSYQPALSQQLAFKQEYSWRHKNFYFSLGTQYTHAGGWLVSAGINGTLGYDYLAQSPYFHSTQGKNNGVLEPNVFVDENANGLPDRGEQMVAGAGFKGSNSWVGKITDETGRVVLPGASERDLQLLQLDERTIKDPFLKPRFARVAVDSHPGGRVKIYVPLVSFSDLEGSLYLTAGQSSKALPRVGVKLKNEQGEVVALTATEIDGYFTFGQLTTGKYQLEIDPEYLAKHHLSLVRPLSEIQVMPKGDSIWLPDILLEDKLVEHNPQLKKVDNKWLRLTASYIQLGVFKKARSIAEVMKHLPVSAINLEIIRDHQTAMSTVLGGPYENREEAEAMVLLLQNYPAFGAVYLVEPEKFRQSRYQQEYLLSDLTELLQLGEEIVMTSSDENYFCQLASYGSTTSISQNDLVMEEGLLVVKRSVRQKIFYTILAGPFVSGELNTCEGLNYQIDGADKGYFRQSSQLKSELLR